MQNRTDGDSPGFQTRKQNLAFDVAGYELTSQQPAAIGLESF